MVLRLTLVPRQNIRSVLGVTTMKRCFALLLFVALVSPQLHAQLLPPLAIDVLPDRNFEYLHNAGEVPRQDFHDALEQSGFYENWSLNDFASTDILGVPWRTGDTPIGHSVRDRDHATEIVAPVGIGGVPTFFRKTFTIPQGPDLPVALTLNGTVGHVIQLDGQEISRNECCRDRFNETNETTYLVHSTEFVSSGSYYRRYYDQIIHVGDLPSGEHTLTALMLRGRTRTDSPTTDLYFDATLFTPPDDNHKYFSANHEDWSSLGNWPFGIPGPSDTAVFSESLKVENTDNIQLRGLRADTGHATIFGLGSITLAAPESVLMVGGFGIGQRLHLQSPLSTNGGEQSIDTLQVNGHTITKSGPGRLTIHDVDTSTESGTLLVNEGVFEGSFHGDIVVNGASLVDINATGNVSISAGSLVGRGTKDPFNGSTHRTRTFSASKVDGDFTGNIEAEFGDTLTGNGGALHVPELNLVINPFRLFHMTPSERSYTLFPNWSDISVDELRLQDWGEYKWDMSRLSEGIVAIELDSTLACDFDMSGACSISDIDSTLR